MSSESQSLDGLTHPNVEVGLLPNRKIFQQRAFKSKTPDYDKQSFITEAGLMQVNPNADIIMLQKTTNAS